MKRMEPDKRRLFILDAAIRISKKYGYRNISRDQVAIEANVSGALINAYFGNIAALRIEVIKTAINEEIPEIIAQYLAVADDHTLEIPERLKTLAAAYVLRSRDA